MKLMRSNADYSTGYYSVIISRCDPKNQEGITCETD